MGKQDVVDKTISPQQLLRALMAGSITIAQAQQMYNGVMPIGDYKGAASILDFDLLVKQPLADAERKHNLGILDGREAAYDSVSCTTVAGEVATAHVGALTVPTGELWFIKDVLMTVPANCVGNWHCSLWTDRLAASALGQPFYAAAQGVGAWRAEFSAAGGVWVITNKSVELRAPAGTVITFVLTSVPVVGLVTGTLQIYGWLGKPLVD